MTQENPIEWETWQIDAWSGGSPLPEGLKRAPGETPESGAMHRGHEIRVFRLLRGGYRTYVSWDGRHGFVGIPGQTRADAVARTKKMIDRAARERPGPRANPTLASNPVSGGAVALAALAVAGVAWLLLRPKEAQAAPPTKGPVELPSFVPSSTPAPPSVPTTAPKLPPLNCAGKVRVTYKFKDSPLLLNVFRRLTTWSEGSTSSIEDHVWVPSSANTFFNSGTQDPPPLESQLEYVQDSLLKRYLAEAWVETADGWCLAATSTNYEAWV